MSGWANANRRGWAGFVHRYGWRAYALPILTAVTLVVLVRGNPAAAQHRAAGPARHTAAAPAGHVVVEGQDAAAGRYRAAATPAPVVIDLQADTPTSCADNTYPRLILVSVREQRLWACDGARQVDTSPVTTGRVSGGDQTPLGSWRVQAKQRDRYLVGPGYRDYVHYWVPFNGDFGLHDATWQTMPFGSPGWRTEGSHGCVHTPMTTMTWVYNWAQVGRTVVTVEA